MWAHRCSMTGHPRPLLAASPKTTADLTQRFPPPACADPRSAGWAEGGWKISMRTLCSTMTFKWREFGWYALSTDFNIAGKVGSHFIEVLGGRWRGHKCINVGVCNREDAQRHGSTACSNHALLVMREFDSLWVQWEREGPVGSCCSARNAASLWCLYGPVDIDEELNCLCS